MLTSTTRCVLLVCSCEFLELEKDDRGLQSLFKVFSLPWFYVSNKYIGSFPSQDYPDCLLFLYPPSERKLFSKVCTQISCLPLDLGILCFHGYKYHHHAGDFHVSVFSQIISFKIFMSKNPFNPFNYKTTERNGDCACREQCPGLQQDFGDRPGSSEEVLKIDFGN